MTSINPHFTFKYSQPDEYHFSHDSVFLARAVFECLKDKDISQLEVLDLCAGCGIIGLDFMFHCQNELKILPKRCDFLEIQEVYKPHFLQNASRFPDSSYRFIQNNYDNLINNSEQIKYDLIMCNPPYFDKTQGKLSPSEFKNRCRFYLDSTFEKLLEAVALSLKQKGTGFILIKNLTDHKKDNLKNAISYFEQTLKTSLLSPIRGTDVLKIESKL